MYCNSCQAVDAACKACIGRLLLQPMHAETAALRNCSTYPVVNEMFSVLHGDLFDQIGIADDQNRLYAIV
jgi:hypothetical protein